MLKLSTFIISTKKNSKNVLIYKIYFIESHNLKKNTFRSLNSHFFKGFQQTLLNLFRKKIMVPG